MCVCVCMYMRFGEIFCVKNESICSKRFVITGIGYQRVQYSQTNKLETLNCGNKIESKGDKNVGSNSILISSVVRSIKA